MPDELIHAELFSFAGLTEAAMTREDAPKPDFIALQAFMQEQIFRNLAMPAELMEPDASNYASSALNMAQFQKMRAEHFMPLTVWENSCLTEHRQYRFPRSKKKRIRNKWLKDARNYRAEPMRGFWIMGGKTIIMHPRWRRTFKRLCVKAGLDRDIPHLERSAFNREDLRLRIEMPSTPPEYPHYDPRYHYFREVLGF